MTAFDRELLDPINRRLLEELQADARLSMAELGRRINLSAPAVADRVQRLERAGIISGYRALVDPKAIGFPIGVIVRIRPATSRLHQIPELARDETITPKTPPVLAPREALNRLWPFQRR